MWYVLRKNNETEEHMKYLEGVKYWMSREDIIE